MRRLVNVSADEAAAVLKRVDALTYRVVNTPLLIRKTEARFSPDNEVSWDLIDESKSGDAVDTLTTLVEARHAALKLTREAHQDYWKMVP